MCETRYSSHSLNIFQIWALQMPLSNKIAVSCILLLGVLLVISISEKQESHNLQSRRSRYRKISNVLQD
jgi:hypothetical protein